MTPTLEADQFVLVHPGASYGCGDIVVARHPSQPVEIVKRVAAIADTGLVRLSSDNPAVGSDSRQFGSVDPDSIIGRVTLLLNAPQRRLDDAEGS